ncbi:hypothetical protein SE17_11305 [Kouleothrix aurantiaca]|uniref:DUF2085 domain-containing protein n=1 Tax=Kouleothrix aurantiaca TaxID=186479 RepID=A0A0P9FJ58_9CHLR|nr:hypothetical protein SE17_11305 [Kouleothrix aurantiaca]
MNERTSDEIIEMARGEMSARRVQQAETRGLRELPWRYALFGLAGVLLLGLLAWPGMPLEWKMYAVVHGVCAQAHTVDMAGLRLPLCARNTGIYSGFLVTVLFLLALGRARAAKLPPIPILATLIAFLVVMAVDGFNSMLVDLFMPHLYTPQNELRTLTGMGMGVAIAVLMFLIINLSLRQNPDTNQRIMNGWLELGGALLLNLLVLAAMYGNVALMFWPIAFTAWLGITGILYAINVLLTALFMGYEGRVTRMIQLAKPATWALLFTLVELWSLAAARFWLEAQGLIIN